MDYNALFHNALAQIKEDGRYRYFNNITRIAGQFPRAYFQDNHGIKHPIVVWCSNDYLCMGQEPAVLEAMHKTLDRCGAGAGGTRNISGNTHYHLDLEKELAVLHGREAALLFTSGYVANEGALGALLSFFHNGVVFSDAGNHASIIHGIRSSRIEKHIFAHNNLKDLESKLKSVDLHRPKIIVFESVYSMDGDFSPMEAFCDLADQYNAMTYVDEVHAIGIYGSQGMGLVEQHGLQDRITVIQSNFGKAVGIIGGYITGSHCLVDFVRSFAPPFIFTTALPPVIVEGVRASLTHFTTSSVARDRLWHNVNSVKTRLYQGGFPFLDSGSHIIPLIIGDAHLCRYVADRLLLKHGVYVQPINYPTVPKGTERLRITPLPTHTPEMIDELIEACSEVWHHFGLLRQKKSA